MKISLKVWHFIGILPGLYFPLSVYMRTKPMVQDSYVFTFVSLAILALLSMTIRKVEKKDELAAKIMEKVNSNCFKVLVVILAALVCLVMLKDALTIAYVVAFTIPVMMTIRAILFFLYDLRGLSQ